jgi:Domain of unknown function (DUF4352)
MKNKTFVFPHITLAVLILVPLSCGASSYVTHKVGDVIQVGDNTIVLNNAKLQGGKLSANFTIENKGTKDLAVSSLVNFSAKDSEGTKLEREIFHCGTAGAVLDGKVLPGDKLKGNICWKGATTDTVKIYYEAALFGSGTVVWEITK